MEGWLVINLEPPCLGFAADTEATDLQRRSTLRAVSADEVRRALLTLGISVSDHWPIDEYTARIHCHIPEETLRKLKLTI